MCYWTHNSLTCAIKVRIDPINLQIWKQGRSEFSIEIGTIKLGQEKSELSHVKWYIELENSGTQNSYLTAELTECFIYTVWKYKDVKLHIFKH